MADPELHTQLNRIEQKLDQLIEAITPNNDDQTDQSDELAQRIRNIENHTYTTQHLVTTMSTTVGNLLNTFKQR